MAYRYTSLAARMQVKMTTERIMVPKVIDEQVGQLAVETELSIDALQIDHVQAELREMTDQQFAGKVVKHGVVHQDIYYAAPDRALKCICEDTPFMLSLNFPTLTPNCFTEVQSRLLDITPEYQLLPPTEADTAARLQLRIVAHILAVAVEWTQLDVVTRVDIFPRHN